MSAKSYIVKKINDLPTFTGTLDPNDLVAFFDISTGITHKIKVSEIGAGAQGTTDHSQLTQESRALPDQHPIGAITGLQGELDSIFDSQQAEIAARMAKDGNLQSQIFEIVENSPIDIVRFFMTTQITLLGQTYNLSSETKGAVAATPITVSVTGTDRATSNRIARFIGDTPLTVERLIPVQNTQIFIRANKNNTTRLVYIYFDFYDYQSDGTTTLKGSTSDVLIRDAAEVYNLLLQVAEYTAQIGARSLIDCRTYQTGAGVAAQTTISIAGDYVSRFQYKLQAGSLSFLDEKLTSTQDLDSLALLSGATQKEVNAAQNILNAAELMRNISQDSRITAIEDDAVLVSDIDMSDVNVGEKKILVAEKGADNLPKFGGVIGLLDVFATPTLATLLDESNPLWEGDYITLTGDNRQGQLGENSQFFEKNGDIFLCKLHNNGTTALNGSATWSRNRGQDSLKPETIALHATIVGQLTTETGWNAIAQFKQIGAESKRGSWYRAATGGYLFMCIDDANGWTRVGTPPTIELEITMSSHPILTASLAAHDFSANRFYVEKTNASDETAGQGQEWWDTANKYVYKRGMNGNWAKIN